jgi:integrase
MATIRRRGERWFVQVRRRGYPSQSKSFGSKADARAWATAREAELDRGGSARPHPASKKTTLRQVIDRYLTEVTPRKRGANVERYRLSMFCKAPVSNLLLSDLTPAALATFRDERAKLVAPATVRREMNIIRHVLRKAMRDWGYGLTENPADMIERFTCAQPRDRRLTAEEWLMVDRELKRCRNTLVREVAIFARETAMRRSEILDLTWANVNIGQGTARIPLTKNGDSRTVPLSPVALEVLRRAQPRSARVFPISRDALRHSWERAIKRSGVSNFRFHDLRHEAVSSLFEMGLSLPEVALVSGHRDARILIRYTHLKPTDVVRKLAEAARR